MVWAIIYEEIFNSIINISQQLPIRDNQSFWNPTQQFGYIFVFYNWNDERFVFMDNWAKFLSLSLTENFVSELSEHQNENFQNDAILIEGELSNFVHIPFRTFPLILFI